MDVENEKTSLSELKNMPNKYKLRYNKKLKKASSCCHTTIIENLKQMEKVVEVKESNPKNQMKLLVVL